MSAHGAGQVPERPGSRPSDDELRSGSARFDELWRAGRSGRLRSLSKTIAHPELGTLTLDCDALLVPAPQRSAVPTSVYLDDSHSKTPPGKD
ncbi:MmyB family transcriptional regulator [Nocardia amikacinitolerans]|uniref:MmyB family transcriptional regulator n=1 Tax=Nocardia amikacinitolerans TaxID=756689 RepID=UPI0035A25D6A